MDEIFDAEDAIKDAEGNNWTKVSEELPTKPGRYLVVRGHWYMGHITYKIAVTDFHPKKWQNEEGPRSVV